jgi:diketogulonate reductase-like aldo/keto reductase
VIGKLSSAFSITASRDWWGRLDPEIGARRLRQDIPSLLSLLSCYRHQRVQWANVMPFGRPISSHYISRYCRKLGTSQILRPTLATRNMASATPVKSISRLFDEKPAFIYGTAWKKDQTKSLVKEALKQGFRRVDTAAQPKHYQEHLVGEALREAYIEGTVSREDIYVQTKYTTPAGQELNNMPYDLSAPLDTQIHTSIASSLGNLRQSGDSQEGSYIDCVLLHSPLPTIEQTLQAWKLLESYVPHRIKTLGISNVTLPVLQEIVNQATVKPSVVQNRFYPQTRYDGSLRAFCRDNGITYQSFWTLTGNPKLLRSKAVVDLAKAADVSLPNALYALVMDLGVEVLNGTTSTEHMQEDLQDIRQVRDWATSNTREWAQVSSMFASSIESHAF